MEVSVQMIYEPSDKSIGYNLTVDGHLIKRYKHGNAAVAAREVLRQVAADPSHIRVWPFESAPDFMAELYRHGVDEDWVALVPVGYDGPSPLWVENEAIFGMVDKTETIYGKVWGLRMMHRINRHSQKHKG